MLVFGFILKQDDLLSEIDKLYHRCHTLKYIYSEKLKTMHLLPNFIFYFYSLKEFRNREIKTIFFQFFAIY